MWQFQVAVPSVSHWLLYVMLLPLSASIHIFMCILLLFQQFVIVVCTALSDWSPMEGH